MLESISITCDCGREVHLVEDTFGVLGQEFIGRCLCGRIWKLEEISGEAEFEEMTEEEEVAYSIETGQYRPPVFVQPEKPRWRGSGPRWMEGG